MRIADEPSTAIGRCAAAINSRGARNRGIGRRRDLRGRRQRRHRLVGRRDGDIFRQIEMHRSHRLAQREADRLDQCLADAPFLQLQRRLGDRLEQRVVVDPHLDAAAELIGVEIAGDGDHRRAVEPGVADAGREVGRARPERRDAQPRRARHAAGDIGGKTRRAFVRGEHEIDAALAHRLHQRQHVAARNAEAARDAGGLERGDDEIGVVHEKSPFRMVWVDEELSRGFQEFEKLGGLGGQTLGFDVIRAHPLGR